jgi:hypothetical protein
MSITSHGPNLFGTQAAQTAVTFVLQEPDLTTVSGYVAAVTAIDVTHNGDISEARNGSGAHTGVAVFGEVLEATFELLPTGANVAAALVAARIPKLGSTLQVSNAKVISVGSFADAINAATGHRWIYLGGASLRQSSDGGPTTLSLPVRKYPLILGNAAATVT